MKAASCKTALLLSLLLAAGCSGDGSSEDGGCDPSWTIVPGQGVERCGQAIRIGDQRSDLETLLGAPSSMRDLGPLGLSLSFPSEHLLVQVSGDVDGARVSALYLQPGFDGQTEGRLGIGGGLDRVEAELGEPSRDPFLGALIYRKKGIAFEPADQVIGSIHLFTPDE